MSDNKKNLEPVEETGASGQEEYSLNDDRRVKVLSPGAMVAKRFFRNRIAVVGLVILAFMFLFSFLGGVISPYGENQQFYRVEYQNKDYAMKMLRSKLVEIKEREQLEKIEDIKGVQSQIAWGAQIRSYVFMPYTLVKDTRTGFENGNIQAVMDGDIDGFINAYLAMQANK